MPAIDIYPVGLLAAWQQFIHNPNRAQARASLRMELRRMGTRVRNRQWRALRSCCNGYLAEHPTRGSRAGHGWTRGRAVRDLATHLGVTVEQLANSTTEES